MHQKPGQRCLLASTNRWALALPPANHRSWGRDPGHSCLPLKTSAVPTATEAVTVRKGNSGDGPHQGVVSVTFLCYLLCVDKTTVTAILTNCGISPVRRFVTPASRERKSFHSVAWDTRGRDGVGFSAIFWPSDSDSCSSHKRSLCPVSTLSSRVFGVSLWVLCHTLRRLDVGVLCCFAVKLYN